MGCYMDDNTNIFFYDPNDGKEVKFNNVDKLKKYLKSKEVKDYFTKDQFVPEVWMVNHKTKTNENDYIKEYYSNLEKFLDPNALICNYSPQGIMNLKIQK